MMNGSLHSCQLCPRLTQHRRAQKEKFPQYHCLPVAPYGNEKARLLIVGLAPGLHGANASGRPFTGDASGSLLFKMLYRYGFANQPESLDANDSMELNNCRITNAVKCLPPQNKPSNDEVERCNPYLKLEIAALSPSPILLALGAVAHRAVIKAIGGKQSEYPFAHARQFELEQGPLLIDSYHCSRYNINTRRLTESMFAQVFADIQRQLQ